MNDILLSSYSPGLVRNEALESVLVQRDELISSIVRKCEKASRSNRKVHTLLIGEAGIGKTFTLSLICSRIIKRENKDIIIVRLNEESWGITSYLDLIHNICSLLPDFAREEILQGSALFKLGSNMAEKALESALTESIADRKILLVIENLDQIFQEIGIEGQKKFRAFLQNSDSVIVLASSRYIFLAISSYNAPFYGFFEIQHLKGLSVQEAQEFLWKLAILNGNQGAQRLLKSVDAIGKVKTIHYLAGGNPRVFMHFYDVLATTNSVQSFINPLMKVLDDLMPAYQSKMLQLSPQQRKIVESLADSAVAMTVKGIADNVFITQQSASSQLRDLKIKHIVESTTSGRESYYDLKDPLFKLCIQLKNNKIEFVNGLLALLEAWFSPIALKQSLGQLHAEDNSNLLYRTLVEQYGRRQENQSSQHFSWVGNENIESEGLGISLNLEQTLTELKGLVAEKQWKEALQLIQELLDKVPADKELLKLKSMISFYLGRSDDTLQSLESLELDEANDELFLKILGNTYGQIGRYDDAIYTFKRVLKHDPHDLEGLIGIAKGYLGNESYRLAIRTAKQLLEIDPSNVEALVVMAESFIDLGQQDEGLTYLRLAQTLSPDSYETRFLESKTLFMQGDDDAAIEILEQIILESADDGIKATAFSKKGLQFLLQKKYFSAVKSFVKAVRLDKDCALYWLWLGESLDGASHLRVGLNCYDRVLATDSKNITALRRKGVSHGKLGELDDALETFKRLKPLDDGPSLVHNLAITYLHQGNFKAALEQLSALPKGYGGRAIVCCRALCLINLGKPNEAEKLLNKQNFKDVELDDVQVLRAMIASAKGEWELASSLARPIASKDASALIVLLDSLEELGRQGEALQEIKNNLQTFDGLDLLHRKGWLEFTLLKFEDAKNTFSQILVTDENDTSALLGCLSACLQGKFYTDAVSLFRDRQKVRGFSESTQRSLSDSLLSVVICLIHDEIHNVLGCIEEIERCGLSDKYTIAAKIILIIHTAGIQTAINKAISNLKFLNVTQIEQISYRFLISSIAYDNSEVLAPFLAALSDRGLMTEFGSACLKVIIDWLENIKDIERAVRCVQNMTLLCETYGIEMERPLKICRTIIEFLQTKDEKLLIQIPVEERSLVQQWLKKQPDKNSIPDGF